MNVLIKLFIVNVLNKKNTFSKLVEHKKTKACIAKEERKTFFFTLTHIRRKTIIYYTKTKQFDYYLLLI